MALALAVAGGPPLLAQDRPTDGAGEGAAAVLRPPRVLTLPEVTLSPEVEVPAGGVVELALLVAADGSATVESCDAGEAICGPVREAIAGARFEPATRDGAAVPARIAMRFSIRREAPALATPRDAPPGEGPEEAEAAPGRPRGPAVVEDRAGFGATARVERVPPGALRLELAEMRELPGAFGDPFRAIEALPGVTPILSGLPYFYVRGAPPSGTLYIYDHIPLPALYHLGFGPAVVHARMIGPLRLHSGVPPARFGRLIGGVIEAEGPGLPEDDGVHGEAELRLLDVTAMIQAPVGRGRVAAAGRYGYPGLLLSIFSPEVSLAYWDYQLRLEHPIGRRDRVEVVWLGSYDSLSTRNEVEGTVGGSVTETTSLTIQFHRLELRLVRTLDRLEIGTALRVGWEESGISEGGDLEGPEEIGVEAFTLGPRLWMMFEERGYRLRVGAEMVGAAGGMSFEDLGGNGELDPQNPGRNEIYASVAARNMAAIYGELSFDPVAALTLDLGLRGDLWATGSSIEAALDPRLRATWHVAEKVDLLAAVGVARQPAVFFIPLPGLAEVAIDRGLQTAVQGELGVAAELPLDLDVEAQLFVHRYSGLLFPDLFVDDSACGPRGICEDVPIQPRVDGLSYGGELFLRRDPKHRLAGFLSYTLAWADIDDQGGIDYTPSYDVRHILNLAGRWDLGGGFALGARAHYRSGKPAGEFYLDPGTLTLRRYEQRLPGFFRLDAQVSYGWATSWGRLRVALEWFNVTFSREAVGMECDDVRSAEEGCPVEYAPAIVVPNLGLRATF